MKMGERVATRTEHEQIASYNWHDLYANVCEYNHHLSGRIAYFLTALGFVGGLFTILVQQDNKLINNYTLGQLSLAIITIILLFLLLHEQAVYTQHTRDRLLLYRSLAIAAEKSNDIEAERVFRMLLGSGRQINYMVIALIIMTITYAGPVVIVSFSFTNLALICASISTTCALTIIVIYIIIYIFSVISLVFFLSSYKKLRASIDIQTWTYAAISDCTKLPAFNPKTKAKFALRDKYKQCKIFMARKFITITLRWIRKDREKHAYRLLYLLTYTPLLRGYLSLDLRNKARVRNGADFKYNEYLVILSNCLRCLAKLNKYQQRLTIYSLYYIILSKKNKTRELKAPIAIVDQSDDRGPSDPSCCEWQPVIDSKIHDGIKLIVMYGDYIFINKAILQWCIQNPNVLFIIRTDNLRLDSHEEILLRCCKNIIPIIYSQITSSDILNSQNDDIKTGDAQIQRYRKNRIGYFTISKNNINNNLLTSDMFSTIEGVLRNNEDIIHYTRKDLDNGYLA